MNREDEILKMIAEENEILADLQRQERYHKERTATFGDYIAVLKNASPPTPPQQITALTSLFEKEKKDGDLIGLRIEASNAKKSALDQMASIFNPFRNIPIRRPDWDYSHKDLREGTDIYKVRELLRKTGKPMPLAEIVSELFTPEAAADVKQGKYASLRGTLVGYAKENRVFTIESESPRMVGLIEFNADKPTVLPPRRIPARKFDLKGGEQGS